MTDGSGTESYVPVPVLEESFPRPRESFLVGCCAITLVGCTLTVFLAIFLCITKLLYISLIVVGAINYDNCAIKPEIPLWMIITGAIHLIYSVKKLGFLFCKDKKKNGCSLLFDGLFFLVYVVVLFLGTYWIYSVYGNVQHTDPTASTYCDKGTYWFSFIYMTVGYAFAAVAVCCFCCGVAAKTAAEQ